MLGELAEMLRRRAKVIESRIHLVTARLALRPVTPEAPSVRQTLHAATSTATASPRAPLFRMTKRAPISRC
jgi:hypothetical protein